MVEPERTEEKVNRCLEYIFRWVAGGVLGQGIYFVWKWPDIRFGVTVCAVGLLLVIMSGIWFLDNKFSSKRKTSPSP